MGQFKDKASSMAFCVIGKALPAMSPEFVDLAGKVAIVTGSNSGIGYGLALQLAEMGATVFLACRNKDKTAQARTSMIEECPAAKIEAVDLDLSSFESVRQFAQNWSHGRIHILAHNAGVTLIPESKDFTNDGLAKHYQINFLSSFLLTGLLIAESKLAEDVRIMFTSSAGSYVGKLPDDCSTTQTKLKRDADFHGAKDTESYSNTKLMQAAFARALQIHFDQCDDNKNKRLAFSWEPGFVQSNILENATNDPMLWALSKLQPIVGLNVRQGSATGVHLATSRDPSVIQHTGRYFNRMRPRAHPVDGYSLEKLDRLWARWAADAEIAWPWRVSTEQAREEGEPHS